MNKQETDNIDRILDEDEDMLEYFGKEQYLEENKKKSS